MTRLTRWFITLSLLTAIMVGGRATITKAQPKVEVDIANGTITENPKREPALAVKPWIDATNPADGLTVVATYISETISARNVKTSQSFDGGLTWTEVSQLPNPTGSSPYYDTQVEDQKIAYRLYTTNSGTTWYPELLATYRTAGGTNNHNAVYLTWSTDNGQHWEDRPQFIGVIRDDDRHGTRPIIATDNLPFSSHRNQAYIVYTEEDYGTGYTYVYEKTIAAGSHAIPTNPKQIATSDPGDNSTAPYKVVACDVALDAAGNIYVLWIQRYASTSTFDILISKSTDGGSNWTNQAQATPVKWGVPEVPYPWYIGNYRDYPSLAISKAECDGSISESAFVSYTKQGGASQLMLISAPISNLNFSTQTPIDINDASTGKPIVQSKYPNPGNTANPWNFQYQSQLTPDGLGGVFLVYYAMQTAGSPTYPCAIVYESGSSTGPQKILDSWPGNCPTSCTGCFDFHRYADYFGIAWNPMQHLANVIWTQKTTTTSCPPLGIWSEWVLPGTPPTNPDIGNLDLSCQRKVATINYWAHAVALRGKYVKYSTQRSYGIGGSGWSAPITINLATSSTVVDASACIATYERGNGSGQNAVAICWDEYNSSDGPTVHVVIKESGSCWSREFIFPATCACNSNITPLTKPVSSGSSERYLLGWVITFEDPSTSDPQWKGILSYTLLRGGRTSNRLMQNDNWGDYSNYSGEGVDPDIILRNNIPLAFRAGLTVTANENIAGANDHSNTIVYSSDGSQGGVNAINPQYSVIDDNTLGKPLTTGMKISRLSLPSNLTAMYTDRNPSVTVTSAGQNLAAWEHTSAIRALDYITSNIRIAGTDQTGKWSLVQDWITGKAQQIPQRNYLQNPSITAFPKTRFGASPADPHAAELLYTEFMPSKYPPTPNSQTLPSRLHERLYYSPKYPDQPFWWKNDWNHPEPSSTLNNSVIGVNSQRSFGVYTTGPQWVQTGVNQWTLYDAFKNDYQKKGLTFGVGNVTTGGNAPPISPKFVTPVVGEGAYKMGTFDTLQGEDYYRVESRTIDSSTIEFRWGGVYVEDTALQLPIREVILHNGIPDDTIGFTSNAAIRDSLFATEWFDWPVSAAIVYNRWMGIGSGYCTDTIVDSIPMRDSTIHLLTMPVYHVDSTIRWDSCFMKPGLKMKYTVELVHQSGRIDTVDQMVYNPFVGMDIAPHRVHIVNGSYFADTVKLRIRADFTNVPDGDTNVIFARETWIDSVGSLPDTTLAISSTGPIIPPTSSCFDAVGPYPNPSGVSAGNVSILVHYCSTGSLITAQLYDIIGTPIGSPVTMISDGQTWDRLQIAPPSTPGAYFIQVSVATYNTILNYSVN